MSDSKNPIFIFLTSQDYEEINDLKFTYENVEDIKAIEYKGCDIGYGALSTYIDFSRNLYPIADKEFISYFDKLLRTSVTTLLAMDKALADIEELKDKIRSVKNGYEGD